MRLISNDIYPITPFLSHAPRYVPEMQVHAPKGPSVKDFGQINDHWSLTLTPSLPLNPIPYGSNPTHPLWEGHMPPLPKSHRNAVGRLGFGVIIK